MPGADERRWRKALRRNQRLFECDAFIARQHRLPDADLPIAHPYRAGYVGYLVASSFPWLGRAAQAVKCFQKEGLNVVRLQTPCLSALHIDANTLDTTCIHGVVSQRMILKQVLHLLDVERAFHNLGQARTDLGLFAVTNGFNQQVL